jgi:hypothetical protein
VRDYGRDSLPGGLDVTIQKLIAMVLGGALALAAAATAPAQARAQGPVASAAATCNISGKERKLGATYVTALSTKGMSCRRAERLVKAYHRCRRSRGGADGRCPRVDGYRCSESRTSAPTQYDSRATCRKGSRRIVQRYTQNT